MKLSGYVDVVMKHSFQGLTGLTLRELSAELVDYKRGEDISLCDTSYHSSNLCEAFR